MLQFDIYGNAVVTNIKDDIIYDFNVKGGYRFVFTQEQNLGIVNSRGDIIWSSAGDIKQEQEKPADKPADKPVDKPSQNPIMKYIS